MNNFTINNFNLLEKYTHPTKITKTKKFIYLLLIPYFYFIETIIRYKIWKKTILPELITNDIIIGFLDKQEFSYKKGIIYKQDLLESNEFFDRVNLEEAKETIKKEYFEALIQLFTDNINFNIEDWITILVNVEYKWAVEKNGEYAKAKVYEIKIQYCREYFFLQAKKYLLRWLLIFGIILIPIILFIFHLI